MNTTLQLFVPIKDVPVPAVTVAVL